MDRYVYITCIIKKIEVPSPEKRVGILSGILKVLENGKTVCGPIWTHNVIPIDVPSC